MLLITKPTTKAKNRLFSPPSLKAKKTVAATQSK